jgi:hypothetical protein
VLATNLTPPVNDPALYKVPVVLSTVLEPLIFIKHPATVPEPVNTKVTADVPALVVTFEGVKPADEAAEKVMALRVPE